MGELRESGVNSKIIYLNKSLFKESFGRFFSVWLHELSHSFAGSDGDRSFSDCLTVLIQKCIDNNISVEEFTKDLAIPDNDRKEKQEQLFGVFRTGVFCHDNKNDIYSTIYSMQIGNCFVSVADLLVGLFYVLLLLD